MLTGPADGIKVLKEPAVVLQAIADGKQVAAKIIGSTEQLVAGSSMQIDNFKLFQKEKIEKKEIFRKNNPINESAGSKVIKFCPFCQQLIYLGVSKTRGIPNLWGLYMETPLLYKWMKFGGRGTPIFCFQKKTQKNTGGFPTTFAAEPRAVDTQLKALEVVEPPRELCQKPDSRSVRHVTLRLPKGHNYRAGDHLETWINWSDL